MTIDLPEVVDTLYIPDAAVQISNGTSGVWSVLNGRADYKTVKTGVQTMDGKIQIINGLALEDTVIVYSKSKVTEGGRVRMVSAL